MTSVVGGWNTRSYRGQWELFTMLCGAHGSICCQLSVICTMEYLGYEIVVVCGQEGPMTELTIIQVATHALADSKYQLYQTPSEGLHRTHRTTRQC